MHPTRSKSAHNNSFAYNQETSTLKTKPAAGSTNPPLTVIDIYKAGGEANERPDMSLLSRVKKVIEDGRHYTPTAISNRVKANKQDVIAILDNHPEVFRNAGYTSQKTGEYYYVSSSRPSDLNERLGRFVHHLNQVFPL